MLSHGGAWDPIHPVTLELTPVVPPHSMPQPNTFGWGSPFPPSPKKKSLISGFMSWRKCVSGDDDPDPFIHWTREISTPWLNNRRAENAPEERAVDCSADSPFMHGHNVQGLNIQALLAVERNLQSASYAVSNSAPLHIAFGRSTGYAEVRGGTVPASGSHFCRNARSVHSRELPQPAGIAGMTISPKPDRSGRRRRCASHRTHADDEHFATGDTRSSRHTLPAPTSCVSIRATTPSHPLRYRRASPLGGWSCCRRDSSGPDRMSHTSRWRPPCISIRWSDTASHVPCFVPWFTSPMFRRSPLPFLPAPHGD